MSFREITLHQLEESHLDWKAPVLNCEALATTHRGSTGWHIARCKALYCTFHLRLFALARQPCRNQIRIRKKPWLADRYAASVDEGLLEQILAEEAARIYEGMNPLGLSSPQSMRVILDEYPAAAESVPEELVESARELGAQAGYVIELWNRVVEGDPGVLERLGVADIASQARRDAIVSFITFFRITGNLLAKEGIRRLGIEEYATLLEDYCHRREG